MCWAVEKKVMKEASWGDAQRLGRITSEYATRQRISARFRASDIAVSATAVNLFLRIEWRQAANFAKQGGFLE